VICLLVDLAVGVGGTLIIYGKVKRRSPGLLRRLFGLQGEFLIQEFHNIVTREGDALIADALLSSPTKTKVTSSNGYIQIGTG
jgi:hypothetical protein